MSTSTPMHYPIKIVAPADRQLNVQSAKPSMIDQDIFTERLAQAHRAVNHGLPMAAANLLRSNLEHLLRMVLVQKGWAFKDVDSIQYEDLLLVCNDYLTQHSMLSFFQYTGRVINETASDQNIKTSLPRATHLFSTFLAGWFFLGERLLQESPKSFVGILQKSFDGNDNNSSPFSIDRQSNLKPNPTATKKSDFDLFESGKISLHRSALLKTSRLESWELMLVRLAYFALSLKNEIPLIDRSTISAQDVHLEQITILSKISLITVSMGEMKTILYIGRTIDADAWKNTVTIFTNNRSFVETIETSADSTNPEKEPTIVSDQNADQAYIGKVRSALDEQTNTDLTISKPHVSVETSVALDQAHNNSNSDTASIPALSEGRLLDKSNIVLLEDDHDLAQALQYPFDDWRLFLHPTQKQVIDNKDRTLFIQGGPGTGKTVVLVHKIKAAVDENKRIEKEMGRTNLAKVVVLTFTAVLKENLRAMLTRLDNTITDEHIDLFDLKEFLDLVRTKDLVLAPHPKVDSYLTVRKQGEKVTDPYYYTALFVDEFQDFPVAGGKLLPLVFGQFLKTSKTKLCFTYDNNQMIYHSHADVEGFMKLVPEAKRIVLTYCYRLCKELFEDSAALREHCIHLLTDAAGTQAPAADGAGSLGAKYKQYSKISPHFAMAGGNIELRPAAFKDIQQIASSEIQTLLLKYKPSEIGIIFFHSDEYKGLDVKLDDIKIAVRNLQSEYEIQAMNHLAVKGLEFKAGLVLYAHLPFLQFNAEIKSGRRDGARGHYLRTLLAKAENLKDRLDSHLKTRDWATLDDENLFQDLGRFLYYALIKNPGPMDFVNFTELAATEDRFGDEEKQQAIHHAVNLVKRSKVSNMAGSFAGRTLEQLQSMPSRQLRNLVNTIRVLEEVFAKNYEDWSAIRRDQFGSIDIERALIDFNRFYVTTTRFRESAIVLYDKNVPLRNYLPG